MWNFTAFYMEQVVRLKRILEQVQEKCMHVSVF